MVKTALANSLWWLGSGISRAVFASALDDPGRAQEQLLFQFIRENSATAFGREHGLANVRTHEQFARNVPARDYDGMRPWIDRIRRGEQKVLTSEPVRRLVPTSGSTAARKLIPYTATMHRQINRAVGPWIFDLYRRQPRALLGSSYWSISPQPSGEALCQEESVIPIGFDDDAAYLGAWQKRVVNAAMAVPSEIKHIASIEDWRYCTLLALLRQRHLGLISVWHPSFLTLLLLAMRNDWDRLVADVAAGTCAVRDHLPVTSANAILDRGNCRRAEELRRCGPTAIDRIWPILGVVSCWADGHSAFAAAALAQSMPSIEIQPKGLIATEGVVSIPFQGHHPLAVCSHFYEFEDDNGRLLLAPDLKPEHSYTIILTTGGGLCRYRLGDRVEVRGTLGRTPCIRFVGKSCLISDRMGEKLSDGFVATILDRLFSNLGFRPSFAMLAPELDAAGCRYTLYLNADVPGTETSELDALLSTNPQYAYCRRLAQLGSPRLFRLSGDPYIAYCDRLQQIGQRLGDIKPAGLSCLDAWSRYLAGHYIE
jgi:GH3 auxin-responsive promoter